LQVPALEARLPELLQLQLPEMSQIMAPSGELGALTAIAQSFGMDASHPCTPQAILDAMQRLKAGGICQAAEGAGFGPAHQEALDRLQRFELSRQSIRAAAGVDVLEPHAAKKLARSVEAMRPAARVASSSPAASAALIDWLSRLAALGGLAEAVGWGRRR
jgi:hypothetical protein